MWLLTADLAGNPCDASRPQMRHSKHLIGCGKAYVQLLGPAVGAPLEREVRLHSLTAAGPCCNNQPPLWADTQIGHGETREEVRRSYC